MGSDGIYWFCQNISATSGEPMSEISIIQSSIDETFQTANNQFQALLGHLSSNLTQHLEHGEVENIIKKDGTEILRSILQGHLDLRALNEQQQETVIGTDGVIRSHHRMNCSRKLMSLFGEVEVHRIGYAARGKSSVYLMDEELNLSQDKYSHGLQELVMHETSQHSFDEAVANIDRNTGGHVGKRQVEALTVEISQDFESFYKQGSADTDDSNEEIDDAEVPLLVMTTDGKGIVMRQEDLRAATKKAAENEQHKLKTRLSRGEKRNRKRMATVAAVYDVQRYMRSAEEIMGQAERTGKRPKIENKRVWASVMREATAVTEELFSEAKNRFANVERECVVLVDGDNNQLKRIEQQMVNSWMSATVIVDFIHVLEYLWKAAYCFHDEGSEEAEKWVEHRAIELLNGNVSHTAAGMRRSATLQKLSKKQRKNVDVCANYILKRKHQLRYDEYLAKGYPIATGVIEGACRHLIKDRMDITGARWRLKGAEAVLKLRSLRSSGDASKYFQFYKEQSRVRVYGNANASNSDSFGIGKAA